MLVKCESCGQLYNDEYRWTICPHRELDLAPCAPFVGRCTGYLEARWVWQIKPIFAWYDFWVGIFFDETKKRLYVFPIPMFGFVISRERRYAWRNSHS